MNIQERLQRIVERTNALQPMKVSAESILAKMEADLDVRDAVRAKRAEMDTRQQAEFEAERQAQKPFKVGDTVIWKTYVTSFKGERIATAYQGEVVDIEDHSYYGPSLLVKAPGYHGMFKVKVLRDEAKNAEQVTR